MKTPSEAQELLAAVASHNVAQVQNLLAQSKADTKIYDVATLRLGFLSAINQQNKAILDSFADCVKHHFIYLHTLPIAELNEIFGGKELIEAVCQSEFIEWLQLFIESPFNHSMDSVDFSPVNEYLLKQVSEKEKNANAVRLIKIVNWEAARIFNAETLGEALHCAVLNESVDIIAAISFCFKKCFSSDNQFRKAVLSFKKDNITSIAAAIAKKRWDIVRNLIRCLGFCPDDTVNYPVALRDAAIAGEVQVVQLLLENQASLELVTANPEEISNTEIVRLIKKTQQERAFFTHLSQFNRIDNESEFLEKVKQFFDEGVLPNCLHQGKTALEWLLAWSQHCKTPKQKTILKRLLNIFIQKGADISMLMDRGKTQSPWSTNILAINGKRWDFLQYIYECDYLNLEKKSELLTVLQKLMRQGMDESSSEDIIQKYFSHGNKIFSLLSQFMTTPIPDETVLSELTSVFQNGGSPNCRREDSETPISLIAGWSNATLSEAAFEDALKKMLFLFIRHGANVALLNTEQNGTIQRKIADVNEESSLPMLYPQSGANWFASFREPTKISTSVSPTHTRPQYIHTNPIKIAIDIKNWLFLKVLCECSLIALPQRYALFTYMKNILLAQENGQLIITQYLKEPILSQQLPSIPQPSSNIREKKSVVAHPEEKKLSGEEIGAKLIALVDEVNSLWDNVKKANGRISSTTKISLSKCWTTVTKINEPLLVEIATNEDIQFFIRYMNVLKTLLLLGESSFNFNANLKKEIRVKFLNFVISDETGGLTYTLVTHAKNLFSTNEDYTILARRRDAVWSNFIETMPAGEPSTLELMLRVANPASSLGRLFCVNFIIDLPPALRFLQKKESNYVQKIKDRLALVKKSQPKETEEKNLMEKANGKK